MSITIDQLLSTLQNELGIREMAFPSNLQSVAGVTYGACILREEKLRFSKHFEPDFHAYLYDPSSGTLGLICAIVREQTLEARTRVRQALEQASYLRFQTLSEASGPVHHARPAPSPAILRPLSIELVFLLGAGEESLRQEVSVQIAEAVRETEFLHAIGVALLEVERREDYVEMSEAELEAHVRRTMPLGADSWLKSRQQMGDPERQMEMVRRKFTISDANLRRAFPWLFSSARRWLQQFAQRHTSLPNGAPAPPRIELAQIELENYRRSGTRILTFDPTARIHLVHGHNGSGKSSLVEAIEYALTGRIARFAGLSRERYQELIRYRDADGAAKITFCFEKGEPRSWQPGVTSEQDALALGLSPNAFRLDQTVMSALLSADKVARARVFVEAFFPEDFPRLKVAEESKTAAELVRRDLGEELLEEIRATMTEGQTIEAAVAKRLASLNPATPGQRIDPQLAEGLWPGLSPQGLTDLAALSEKLQNQLALWRGKSDPSWGRIRFKLPETAGGPLVKSARERLSDLAGELREIHGKLPQILETIRDAREALRVANTWNMGLGSSSGQHFQAELNAWLRVQVHTDLKGKLAEVLACYSEARTAGFEGSFGDVVERVLEVATPLRASLEAEVTASMAERDRLLARLRPGQNSGPAVTSGEHVPPPYLSDAKIRALNLAAEWLPDIQLTEPGNFGLQLNNALQQRRPLLGNLNLGKPGWATELIKRLDALEAACNQLRTVPNSALDGNNRLDLLARARQLHAEAHEAAESLSNTFLQKLGVQKGGQSAESESLNAALNEIMALFTPSRWEYEDLQLKRSLVPGRESSEVGLDLTSGTRNLAADLRLNTAQLNIFAVALFLLCAVRIGNPLRLLILDDPLQNMDEVTVTTLARGLGKFARKLSTEWRAEENWRLLLLFHGEDDLQRFIDEIPEAEIHRLPWLAVPVSADLRKEENRFGPTAVTPQTLDQVAEAT